jgi:hypothetical protein
MTDCIPNADQTACINCGWIKPERIKGWPRRNCPASPALLPAAARLGLSLDDVGHYAQALAKWTAAGFPTREQAEVVRIEAEICRPCENYRNGRCAKCGCRVTASSIAIVSKIKMATEHCPLALWPGDPPTVDLNDVQPYTPPQPESKP